MQKEMTIHAALSYLKTADKRIAKLITTSQYVTYAKVNSDKISGVPAQTAKDEMKSDYQSVTDTIKTVEAIKKAISKANAENIITVCGEQMSVAEAIYMMQYGVDVKKTLLNELRNQYTKAKNYVERYNANDLEQRADQFINSMFGGKEKANGNDALKAREDFKKQNAIEVIDPITILTEIKKLEKWIDTFESEVDGAIQVSNATHTIIIDV